MSVAVELWRVLEARHNLRGPDGRFISAGGTAARPSLADVVRGTATLGPKRERRDGMTVADAVRAAARDSDRIGRPTQRTPAQHRAEGAHEVADEVDKALAEAGVPEDVRQRVVARARAVADSHGQRTRPGSVPESPAPAVPAAEQSAETDAIGAALGIEETRLRSLAPPRASRTPARLSVDRARAIGDQLAAAGSRDEARQHLAGLTAVQLRQLADFTQVAVGSGDTKARLQDRLVDSLVGRRLDSDAITRMTNR